MKTLKFLTSGSYDVSPVCMYELCISYGESIYQAEKVKFTSQFLSINRLVYTSKMLLIHHFKYSIKLKNNAY